MKLRTRETMPVFHINIERTQKILNKKIKSKKRIVKSSIDIQTSSCKESITTFLSRHILDDLAIRHKIQLNENFSRHNPDKILLDDIFTCKIDRKVNKKKNIIEEFLNEYMRYPIMIANWNLRADIKYDISYSRGVFTFSIKNKFILHPIKISFILGLLRQGISAVSLNTENKLNNFIKLSRDIKRRTRAKTIDFLLGHYLKSSDSSFYVLRCSSQNSLNTIKQRYYRILNTDRIFINICDWNLSGVITLNRSITFDSTRGFHRVTNS